MAIEIIIKNKSAKKELPSIDVLTGGKFKYGSFDGVRLNMEQKGPDGSISMFNPERIGRGMSVGFGDNEISLFLPLPSSAEEIADFYATAARVADSWNKEVEVSQGGEIFDPYNSSKLAEAAKASSIESIKEITSGKFQKPILFCARWALYLGEGDLKFLKEGNPLEAFSKYMHRMQNIDAYYARPNIMTTKRRDCVFGMYVFTEGVVSIVPAIPRCPFGFKNAKTGRPIEIEDWYISIYSHDEESVLGHLMYDDFLKALKKEDYLHYDAQNILLKGLTRERIDFMLKKFGTLPPN